MSFRKVNALLCNWCFARIPQKIFSVNGPEKSVHHKIYKKCKFSISHILKKSYAKFFIIVVHSLFSLASETFSAKSWTWGILILHFYLHSSTSDLPNLISGENSWTSNTTANSNITSELSAICFFNLKKKFASNYMG